MKLKVQAVEVPISPKTRSIFLFSLGFRSISQRNTLLRGVSLTSLANRMSFEVLVAAPQNRSHHVFQNSFAGEFCVGRKETLSEFKFEAGRARNERRIIFSVQVFVRKRL